MKKLLLKLLGVKEQISVKQVEATELTLTQWRKDSALITEAKKLWANPAFRLMLQVMRNESPVNYGIAGQPDATARISRLGEITGYHGALNNLEAFVIPIEDTELLEATFEPEQKAK